MLDATFIVTWQLFNPVQFALPVPPVHPAKVDPDDEDAVNVIGLPALSPMTQFAEQLLPAGEATTVPNPDPVSVIVKLIDSFVTLKPAEIPPMVMVAVAVAPGLFGAVTMAVTRSPLFTTPAMSVICPLFIR